MKQLQDKVIFLTGGTDGIGYECAKAYIREGAKLVIAAPRNERFTYTKEALGSDHLCVSTDVSVGSEVRQAIEKAIARYGRIDAVHNNAGIAHPAKMLN